jgi:hypothetical protein
MSVISNIALINVISKVFQSIVVVSNKLANKYKSILYCLDKY